MNAILRHWQGAALRQQEGRGQVVAAQARDGGRQRRRARGNPRGYFGSRVSGARWPSAPAPPHSQVTTDARRRSPPTAARVPVRSSSAMGGQAGLTATADAAATAGVAAGLWAGGADDAAVAAGVAPVAAALNVCWAAALVDVRWSLRLALPHELLVGRLGGVEGARVGDGVEGVMGLWWASN